MTSSTDPGLTVTALVVSYNQARFLQACLAGLESQTRRPDQVILIDDCSSDGSAEQLVDWARRARPDATVIVHGRNLGVVATLNEAFGRVTSDTVAPLAADDVWLPEKLEIQLAQMERLPGGVGVLYGDVGQIDETGAPLPESFITSYRGSAHLPEGKLFSELLGGNFLPSPSLLLRTRCWSHVGGFDESLYMEDWDFWLRVSQTFEFRATREEVGKYRVVRGSHVRRADPIAWQSQLATLLKWSAAPEMHSPEARRNVRGLACALFHEGREPRTRPRMAWLWIRYGGIQDWLRFRLSSADQTPGR